LDARHFRVKTTPKKTEIASHTFQILGNRENVYSPIYQILTTWSRDMSRDQDVAEFYNQGKVQLSKINITRDIAAQP